jgi:hypothetical protein
VVVPQCQSVGRSLMMSMDAQLASLRFEVLLEFGSPHWLLGPALLQVPSQGS